MRLHSHKAPSFCHCVWHGSNFPIWSLFTIFNNATFIDGQRCAYKLSECETERLNWGLERNRNFLFVRKHIIIAKVRWKQCEKTPYWNIESMEKVTETRIKNVCFVSTGKWTIFYSKMRWILNKITIESSDHGGTVCVCVCVTVRMFGQKRYKTYMRISYLHALGWKCHCRLKHMFFIFQENERPTKRAKIIGVCTAFSIHLGNTSTPLMLEICKCCARVREHR